MNKLKQFTEIKNFPRQLHEAYKIKMGKKGETITSGRGKKFRKPLKDDHFSITYSKRNDKGDLELAEDIMLRLVEYNAGLKKKKKFDKDDWKMIIDIPIRLLFDEIEKNISYKLAFFQGRKVQCHGNGQVAEWIDDKGVREIVCKWEGCQYYKSKQCKINGRLISVLECAPELGSVATLRTTGFHSVRNIITSLETITRASNGVLAGIPLHLTISPKAVTIDVGGKDTSALVYVANIVFRPVKPDVKEIGTELTTQALQIANVRRTNQDQWEKITSQAEDVQVAITEEEETEQSIKERKEEFYPETVEEEIDQENQNAEQNEEKTKNAILADAKKKMFAAGKNVKTVNQWIAGMRSKSLDEIKAWYKKVLRKDPDKIEVEAEPEKLDAPATSKAPESQPEAPEQPEAPAQEETGEPEMPDDLPLPPGDEDQPGEAREEPQVSESEPATDEDGQGRLF